jgi:uncharacterized membrane protein required for colicin V production
MDIAAFLRSIDPVDVILVILIAIIFAVGYMEGAGRALMALGGWAFSFILAANLRGPLGDMLSGFWSQFSLDYTMLLTFLASFIVALVVCGVAIVSFTKRQSLLPDSKVIDPLLGGGIAVLVSVLVLAAIIGDLDTVYRLGLAFNANDVRLVANLHSLLVNSGIGHGIEESVVPIVTTLTSPLIPAEFVRLLRA